MNAGCVRHDGVVVFNSRVNKFKMTILHFNAMIVERPFKLFLSNADTPIEVISNCPAITMDFKFKGAAIMETLKMNKKRFGMVAVEKQYVTKEQVLEALQVQVNENMSNGIHRQIGAILFDKGQMNASQIQMVIGELASTAKIAV